MRRGSFDDHDSGKLLRSSKNSTSSATIKDEQYYQLKAGKNSAQLLAAGGLEFVDDNYKNSGHSPFTYFFLANLRANSSFYLSASQLSIEVNKLVTSNVFQTPINGILHGANHQNGEFIFVKTAQQEFKKPPSLSTFSLEDLEKQSVEIDKIRQQ